MHLIAMISMLIDHIGIVFFPDDQIWRMIGRIAFPLYAYGIVLGIRHTKDLKSYVSRLALIFVVSQIPYMILFDIWRINVIGTFLAIIGAVWLINHYQSALATFFIVVVASVLLENIPFEYGSYALYLILAYGVFTSHKLVAAHMAINIGFAVFVGWELQLFSIIPTLAIAYGSGILTYLGRVKIPRWLWLSFYPAHLTVLLIISSIMFTVK